MSEILFEPGTLWKRIEACGDAALRSGALQPIATESRVIESQGVRFVVRILAQLGRKLASQDRQRSSGTNPFLPPDPRLVPCEISATHVCVLNKFSILEHHALIVTRAFEEQSSPLTVRDFEAAWSCLADADALVFYNSGPRAGASQPHRHLQLVPLPQGVEGEALPMDPLFERAVYRDGIGRVEALPFRHALVRLDGLAGCDHEEAARRTHDHYEQLQRALDCAAARHPYNLMLTRDRLCLVPRCAAHWHGIPANALGYAGILMVRDPAQLEILIEQGPVRLLAEAGCPSE